MKLLCLIGHKMTKEKIVKYISFVPMYQLKETCSRCEHVKMHRIKCESVGIRKRG